MSTVCLTTQNESRHNMDRSFSRNANTAGAPLPIPRRLSSHSRTHAIPMAHSLSAPSNLEPQFTALKMNVLPPTPPQPVHQVVLQDVPAAAASDSDSSSSDGRPTIAPRAKRIRGQRMAQALLPLQQSTPADDTLSATPVIPFPASTSPAAMSASTSPAVMGSVVDISRTSYPLPPPPITPSARGPLRLSLLPNRAASTLAVPTTIAPVSDEPRLIRKKSGQLVKSSLKSTKSTPRGSISVVTRGLSSSKSEPNTPSLKAVHFDAQLEHVKLFLAEQKPLAVSRDGSPTDTSASGTDTDFPSFIYGSGGDNSSKARLNLEMKLPNFPSAINAFGDLALEELKLSADMMNILGLVRVRNLDFAKCIAVRFTFDSWQTTSEVTAKYVESIQGGSFDRFSFTIKLGDLLPRIEEKTLLLAIRYNVQGREIWDNNNGQNYLATFIKTKPVSPRSRLSKHRSDSENDSGSDVLDLKSKLERLAITTTPSGVAAHARRVAEAIEDDAPPSFKNGGLFGSRYDFGASLKNPWRPSTIPDFHARSGIPTPALSSIPWPTHNSKQELILPPEKPSICLGSPHIGEDYLRPSIIATDCEERPFAIPPSASSEARNHRNHQRGYFDIGISEVPYTLRKTPPGTPTHSLFGEESSQMLSPPRSYSFPPIDGTRSPGLLSPRPLHHATRMTTEGSEESTPSTLSPSTSSLSDEESPALSPSFVDDFRLDGDDSPVHETVDYSNFLNKFCFFTGAVSEISSKEVSDQDEKPLHRTHSASSIEDFFSSSNQRSADLRPPFSSPSPARTYSSDDATRAAIDIHRGATTMSPITSIALVV